MNYLPGLDFDPNGETIAAMDRNEVLVVSDMDTSNVDFHLKIGEKWGQGS